MILASIWYPLETVEVTALSSPSGQRHSLMDDTLKSSLLPISPSALDNGSDAWIRPVFSHQGGLSADSGTYVLATYYVTASLGTPLALSPRCRLLPWAS
jgi:hypothetical protein